MKKLESIPKSVMLTILIALAVVVIGVSGFIYYDTGINQDGTTEEYTIPDDWVQYESDSNDFSLYYPPSWQIQSSGKREDEIVQIFSKKPKKETNIYMCIDIRAAADDYEANDPGELIRKPADNLNIYKTSPQNADHRWWRLTSGSDNSRVHLESGQFRVKGSYNCIQGDNTVIKNKDDFAYEEREEYTQMLDVLSSFNIQ